MYSLIKWKYGPNEVRECEPTSRYHDLLELVEIFKNMDVSKGTSDEPYYFERFIGLVLPNDYRSTHLRFQYLHFIEVAK